MEFPEIRDRLAKKVVTIPPIGKKLKFLLDGQPLVIDGTGEQNSLSEEDVPADCTLIMSVETYLGIQAGEIKPMLATLTGKLKLKGDIGLARKLKELQ